jgi:hypothetical protein
MNGGDDSVRSFPLSTYYCIPPLLVYTNKPKGSVASEVYHVVIAIANRVNRMARLLEGKFGRFAGRRSLTPRVKNVEFVEKMGLISVASMKSEEHYDKEI